MEKKLGEEIKFVASDVKEWLAMEIEYLKLTAAEKVSLIASSLILVFLLLIIFIVAMVVLAFCLVDLFCLMMPHSLACLTVGGILLLIMGVLCLLRKPLFVNPMTKLITKLFLSPKKDEKEQD